MAGCARDIVMALGLEIQSELPAAKVAAAVFGTGR
jgi:hypothetical protein